MRALLVIGLLAGCNSILGIPNVTAIDGGTAPDTTTPDAPDPDLVHGTATDTFWESTTHESRPRDLSTWEFSALVANPATAGGFDTYPGTGTAAGTFAVPGVPVGATFYLRVVDPSHTIYRGVVYFVGATRTFDLGREVLGRPDPVLTTQPTNLVLNIDNMKPYQDTDFFEVFCINNGGSSFGFNFSTATTNLPNVGDTVLAATTLDWSQPYGAGSPRNPVMNGDMGDTLAVIQESSVTLSSGAIVQTMAALYSEKFNQPDGTTYTINASFNQVPSTLSLNPTIMRSLFEAHRAEVNPVTRGQFDADYTYGDSLLPSPDGHPQYGATLDLVVSSLLAGTTDQAFGAFSYPDPFPSGWEHLRIFRAFFGVRFSVDGGSMTGLNRQWSSNRNLDFAPPATLDDVVQPIVTPVLNPMVNGTSAFDAAGGSFDHTIPVTVSWSAPAIGTPTRYSVEVVRAYNDTGKTKFVTEASLVTTAMQVVIPPERFTAGSHYIFVVMAETAPAAVADDAAPMITNVFTAQ